jgi:hypothetical protein
MTLDSLVRSLGNKALDAYGAWRARRYDAQDTIVVACTGRGGSTWLAQIIAALPRHHLLWEQLHWRTNPECQEYGFGEPVWLTERRATEEQEEYVRRILAGRTLSRAVRSTMYFQPWSLLTVRAYVAKFVTANMLLPWLVDTSGVRAVYMIRHPCAVVASQLRHGAWDEVEKSFCRHPSLFTAYPHLGEVFDDIEHHEEVLAFNWAVQNFVPLSVSPPRPWVTTTYETLVEEGMDEATRIFEALGEEVPDKASSTFSEPSVTTNSESNVAQNKNPLVGWRNELQPQQIDRIFSVAQRAGISFYTEALRPAVPPESMTVSVA